MLDSPKQLLYVSKEWYLLYTKSKFMHRCVSVCVERMFQEINILHHRCEVSMRWQNKRTKKKNGASDRFSSLEKNIMEEG